MPTTSNDVIAQLLDHRTADELAKLRNRLEPDEAAFGLRMRDLFDIAKTHRDLPLEEVEALLGHIAYEPRLTAFCILDFKARRRVTIDERHQLYDTYLRRHDSITSWDMVDRAAPRVVGGHLHGRSLQPLHHLADSTDPLRRRTAITAPLEFVVRGSDDDVANAFGIARQLADDPEPVVHNAVGIFLKHAGQRNRDALRHFLDDQAPTMARPALRLAIEKLDTDTRARYRHLGRD